MRTLSMILMIVLLVAATTATAVTPQEFADRLEQVNAIDRWIPAGTIISHKNYYGTNRDGQEYQYAKQITADYSGENAVIETVVVSGELPIPPMTTDTQNPEGEHRWISGDSTVWIDADGMTVLPKSGHNTARYALKLSTRPYTQGRAPLSKGTITTFILDRLRANGGATIDGQTATVNLSNGGQAVITVDSDWRVREMVVGKSGFRRQFKYRDFIEVGGKSVPQHIDLIYHAGNRIETREFDLYYEPGTPTIPVPTCEIKNFPVRNTMEAYKDSDYSTAPEKTSVFWKCIHDDMPYRSYFEFCCRAEGAEMCYSITQNWVCCHGHCRFTYLPVTCSSTSQPVILRKTCVWEEESEPNPLCSYPSSKCFADEDTDAVWEGNVCEYMPYY